MKLSDCVQIVSLIIALVCNDENNIRMFSLRANRKDSVQYKGFDLLFCIDHISE